MTEPSGTAFAQTVFNQRSYGSLDVLIVRGDGTTTLIPGHDLTSAHFDLPDL